jgi:5-hydroxyisourate hydrolase
VSHVTTHVLDTSSGRPAEGVPVVLERAHPSGAGWEVVGRGVTDADGRQRELAPDGRRLAPGRYRLTFDTAAYFTRTGRQAFFPEVAVVFAIGEDDGHAHVPLLLAPYGYSTYRGS